MIHARKPHHTGIVPVLKRLHVAKTLHLETPRSKQSCVVPNRFCESCSRLITQLDSIFAHFQKIPSDQRYSVQYHYSGEGELTKGVRGGCHLCSKFLGVLYSLEDRFLVPNKVNQEYEDAIYIRVEENFVSHHDISNPGVHTLHKIDKEGVYSVTIRKIGKVSQQLDVFTHSLAIDYTENRQKPATEAQISCFTGSDACYDLIRDWLQTCTTQHTSCKPENSLRRPTRLLDLDFDETIDARLVEGNEVDAPYATLSYSWGTAEQTMLLPALYQQFKSRIRFNSLSNVIQDAITVCRGLSIRYIWIDALCIIQGAEGDFAQEAVRMIHIYGGSTITITAAATTDTTQNFLVYRDALQIMDCVLDVNTDGRRGYLRDKGLCNGYWESNLRPGQYHVDSRVWAMQERFLSPRSVYFGPTGIHWECRRGIACEFHVDVDDDRVHKRPKWYDEVEKKPQT